MSGKRFELRTVSAHAKSPAGGEQGRASPLHRIGNMLGVGTGSPARTASPLAPIREPSNILERPEPLVVEAKIIDRYQSYDAWRAVSLCIVALESSTESAAGISGEGIDVTPLNDPSARVRVAFPAIKGVRKLEEHIIEFEWRVPADAMTAKKTSFFCPTPVDTLRTKFTACIQYLMQQRKRPGLASATDPAAPKGASDTEHPKPASSPRGSNSGILSFLFTGSDNKEGPTPPLPALPTAGAPAPSAADAAHPDSVVRPVSPKPVASSSNRSLSSLLNWGSSDDAATTASPSTAGRAGSGRTGATATPPPASQPEKPSDVLPPTTRSALGLGTILKGWSERKDAPPPIDPKVVETLQKEIKDLETALKEANQRHTEAVHRLEALQHLDPILTAAEEKTALATKKIQEADAKIASTEEKVRTLEHSLVEANKRVAEMSEAHAGLQAKARNADHFEVRAREAESKLATTESALTTLQNHYDAAVPKLVASENRVRDAETRAIEAGRKGKEASDELTRLKALLKEAEKTLEQQSTSIRGLESRLDVATRLVKDSTSSAQATPASNHSPSATVEAKPAEAAAAPVAADAPVAQSANT